MRGGRISAILCLAALSLTTFGSLTALGLTTLLAAGDRFAERSALVDEIESYGRRDPPPGKRGFDERVLQALRDVERHNFVPESQQSAAYANHPLPIGHGQTISQPYIVALMTDLVQPQAGDVVLEVGTGSGYQAAVLAKLVREVHTIEIIEPLATQAKQQLERLGYDNVSTRLGDGYFGWEEKAPFDAIVVTAAASHVPPPLIAQLKPGGRMVIPVGGRFAVQYLLLVEKTEAGETITRQVTAVRFVPLTGEH
ncbi:MAG: protein-L-isoaspartate(D-aspartate) O-methyltransferase [Lysobacterales bacterium]